MPIYLAIVAAAAPAETSLLMKIAVKYEAWKLAFSEWAMFSDRELHVSLGLLVFFLTMILFRRPMRSVWPWLAVILFEMINDIWAWC
jgi:hypothetical protein